MTSGSRIPKLKRIAQEDFAKLDDDVKQFVGELLLDLAANPPHPPKPSFFPYPQNYCMEQRFEQLNECQMRTITILYTLEDGEFIVGMIGHAVTTREEKDRGDEYPWA